MALQRADVREARRRVEVVDVEGEEGARRERWPRRADLVAGGLCGETMSVSASVSRVSVPKLWPGETFVVIGGGASLTHEDVAYCRDRARVVAIKEAGCCRIPGKQAPAP